MKNFNEVVAEILINEATALKNGESTTDLITRALKMTQKRGVFWKQVGDELGDGAYADVEEVNGMLEDVLEKMEDILMNLELSSNS